MTSRAHASCSLQTPDGGRRIDAIRNHEQIREFCQFLAHEWRGTRHHSYAVPSRGKSSAWSRTVDGKWSAVGLADAVSKYAWSGKNFAERKAELDRFAADLQSAMQWDSNNDVCAILRAIMHWGGASCSSVAATAFRLHSGVLGLPHALQFLDSNLPPDSIHFGRDRSDAEREVLLKLLANEEAKEPPPKKGNLKPR